MHKAYIEPTKCIRCPKCHAARACPIKAVFRISNEDPSIVDVKLCRGCGDCTATCPVGAVVLRETS